jgi:uncharacterized protein (TIGR02453 family)
VTAAAAFRRFPDETQAFLRSLRANNRRDWFEAHQEAYQRSYVEPAKAFVEEAGRRLRAFVPEIRAEPRILGSIFRIHRDTRHAPPDRPYKDHLDFWFWQGPRSRAVSGLFARVAPDFVGIGVGCHGFDPERLAIFRAAVAAHTSGGDLSVAAAAVEQAGYELSGRAYKRMPKGHPQDGPASRFLLFKALYVHVDEPASIAVSDGAVIETCLQHWRALLPLHEWITRHVQDAAA